MKKINNKGFTMIELLAVFVILGIISTITIPAVSKYLDKAKNKDFEALAKSAYNGAKNYVLDNSSDLEETTNISISTLEKNGYIDNIKNPYNNEKNCTGTVTITKKVKTNNNDFDEYQYRVELDCGIDHQLDKTYNG